MAVRPMSRWPVVAGVIAFALSLPSDPIVILASIPGGLAFLAGVRSFSSGERGFRTPLVIALGAIGIFASAMGFWGLAEELGFVHSEPPVTSCELSPFCNEGS